jgi:hypothetical protein
MISGKTLSPAKLAIAKARLRADQPWLSIGLAIAFLGLFGTLIIGRHGAWVWLKAPFVGFEFLGVLVESYGLMRMVSWKESRPFTLPDREPAA